MIISLTQKIFTLTHNIIDDFLNCVRVFGIKGEFLYGNHS
jgi:hypothetical protein